MGIVSLPVMLVIFGVVAYFRSPVVLLVGAVFLAFDLMLLRRFAWTALTVELTDGAEVVFERPVGVWTVGLEKVRWVRNSRLDEPGAQVWGAVIVTDDGAQLLDSRLPREQIVDALQLRNPGVRVNS